MIKINNRLKLIGDLVDKNDNVLDIGCDHGLLEIYLLKKKIKVVGTDNKKGPLDICKSNLKKEKVKCELRLGDGLDTYSDEDTVIISGMGGLNIIKILKKDVNKSKKVDKYILSPNNYIKDVRMYLNKLGYYIEDEKLIKDKYIYTVIVFKKGKKRYNKKEYYFGPILLKNKNKLFNEYYKKDLNSKEIIIKLLPKNDYYHRLLLHNNIKMIKKELN